MKFPFSTGQINYTYKIKGFDPICAINNICISEIKEGQIIFIVGPNGSGKTTLLNELLRILPEKFNLKVAYIPQNPFDGIVPDISIFENLMLRRILMKNSSYSLRKIANKSTLKLVKDLLNETGFLDILNRLNHPPEALSGGQQQLLNLLSVIISDPDVILLDEPSSKLDEVNKIILFKLLIEAAKKTKAPIICATHDLEYVYRAADRIIKIDNGCLVSDQIIRFPFSDRFIGEIRLVNNIAELPFKFNAEDFEWWKSGVNNFFPIPYELGDDSKEGFLNKTILNREKRTQREVNGLLNLLEINKPGKQLLDIPCGWGRHSIKLGEYGQIVTGIDLCPEYIERAKKSVVPISGQVDFKVGDILNVDMPDESFDFIINLWTSFGFFDDVKNEYALSELSRLLKKGGKVLIHSDLNPYRVTKGIFDEPVVRTLEKGRKLIVREYYNASDSFIYGNWNIIKGDQNEYSKNYRIRVYTELEWRGLAERHNFSICNFYGSFDESSSNLTPSSQEFIIILKKNGD